MDLVRLDAVQERKRRNRERFSKVRTSFVQLSVTRNLPTLVCTPFAGLARWLQSSCNSLYMTLAKFSAKEKRGYIPERERENKEALDDSKTQ